MNEPLIERLVSELQPVPPLSSPLRRAVRFCMGATAIVSGAVLSFGARAELGSRVHDPWFCAETAVLVLLFCGASVAAFASAVPGAKMSGTSTLLGLLLSAWLALIAARGVLPSSSGAWTAGIACLRRSLWLGSAPALILLGMVRKGAPLDGASSGLLTLLSAGALAVLGTRALCAKDDARHVLLWHFMPLLVAALLGALAGRRWFGTRAARGRP